MTEQIERGPEPAHERASAVLPAPALLQRGTSGEVDQVYLELGARWASYTKVMSTP